MDEFSAYTIQQNFSEEQMNVVRDIRFVRTLGWRKKTLFFTCPSANPRTPPLLQTKIKQVFKNTFFLPIYRFAGFYRRCKKCILFAEVCRQMFHHPFCDHVGKIRVFCLSFAIHTNKYLLSYNYNLIIFVT